MKYEPPAPVKLTKDEASLWQLVTQPSHLIDDWEPIADAQEQLTRMLIERMAIPEARLQIFIKLHKPSFVKNGRLDEEIFRCPHFTKYLDYFIHGPALPSEVSTSLCDLLNNTIDTSGGMRSRCRALARQSVRQYHFDKQDAATAFYRLAVEIGLGENEAKALRQAVMTL